MNRGRLKAGRRNGILLLAAFIAAVLCLAEYLMRRAIPGIAQSFPHFNIFANTPPGIDDSDIKRYMWSIRRKDFSPGAPEQAAQEYHPIRGWGFRSNVKDRIFWQEKRFNTNSRGLRGAKEHPYEKRRGTVRIATFGDSYTAGHEVSDDETYSHYLEKMLPGTEVLNFGVFGYGHDQQLIYLREEGLKYSPNIIIVGVVHVDFNRNIKSFYSYSKPRFQLDRNGGLVLENMPVVPPAVLAEREVFVPKLWGALKVLGTAAIRLDEEGLTRAIFGEFARLANAHDAVLILAYMPSGPELSNPEVSPEEALFFRHCADLDALCVSVIPEFEQEVRKGARFDGMPFGHWPPAGHRLIAASLKDYLTRNGVLATAARRDEESASRAPRKWERQLAACLERTEEAAIP